MRRIVILLLILISTFSCINNSNRAKVSFEKRHHDFGKVNFKSECTYSFSFINVGDRPILIESVFANCGCINVLWTEKAINPGEVNLITVGKDTSIPGPFHDKFIVYYKDYKNSDTLRISGSVIIPK